MLQRLEEMLSEQWSSFSFLLTGCDRVQRGRPQDGTHGGDADHHTAAGFQGGASGASDLRLALARQERRDHQTHLARPGH